MINWITSIAYSWFGF